MRRKTVKLLYRSLEVPLGKRAGDRLARHLEESPELRAIRENLLSLRRRVADSRVSAFRPGFVERTLALARSGAPGGAAQESFAEACLVLFRPFAVAALLLLAVGVCQALLRGDIIPKDALYYASDLSLTHILQLTHF